MKKGTRLLDVAGLAEEYGPSKAFWREVVAKGLLPVVRSAQFRQVLVQGADLGAPLKSWRDRGHRRPGRWIVVAAAALFRLRG